jgi:phosphate transport system substrate-binding protein
VAGPLADLLAQLLGLVGRVPEAQPVLLARGESERGSGQAGKFIHADLPSVTAAAKGALQQIPEDLRFSLTNAPGEDAYPISVTVWAVCYVHQPPDRAHALTSFLRWITQEGQTRAAALHYAHLPGALVERVDKQLSEIRGR